MGNRAGLLICHALFGRLGTEDEDVVRKEEELLGGEESRNGDGALDRVEEYQMSMSRYFDTITI